MRIASRSLRRVQKALVSGRPRRARALARLYRRTTAPADRVWFVLLEANALLWEGEHARAAKLADDLARRPDADALGVLPLVVKLEALLFDERIAEARALFADHESELRASPDAEGDVLAIDAMFRFADDALEDARAGMRRVFLVTGPLDPIRRVAHFALAAIAHRKRDDDQVRRHLEAAAQDGGELFPARWAKAQLAVLFPAARAEPSAPTPGPVRRLFDSLGVGVALAFFRTAPFARHRFSLDRVFVLACLDAALVIGLRAAMEYQTGVEVYWIAVLALVAPLAGVALTARMAAGSARDEALRVAGGFYAAFPVFAVIACALGRLWWSQSALVSLDVSGSKVQFGSVGSVAGVVLLVWAFAVLVVAVRAVRPLGFGRLAATLVVFVATFALPFRAASDGAVVFYPAVRVHDWEADAKRRDALVFGQADEIRAAEDALRIERPGVTDLYFVGAAGWTGQDVFGRDVRHARRVVEDRFDTTGRSIVLVNDPFGVERAPLASTVSLRHVLREVGRRMNRDEDVLFLYLTSHGSANGLAFTFPREAAFRAETLEPTELRSMLDESGIRYRILVIAGCASGVFVGPLADDAAVVATAAAPDSGSYGCEMGNEQTEFGRAVFADHLKSDGTIVGALQAAVADIDAQEKKDGRMRSRPQLSVGKAIAPKLAELEDRARGSSFRVH